MSLRVRVAVVALCAAWATCAAAQSRAFAARLATTPVDQSLQATVTGSGAVDAALDGRELTVEGSFSGLAGPATTARLHVSPVRGVRGPVIADLEIDAAASGTLEGTVRLSRAHVDALAEGRLYVQIASEPAPEGNLWGWLLP